MSRLKIVDVSEVIITDILSLGTRALRVTANPLPPDARLVAVAFDGRSVSLTYRSEEFPLVPYAHRIPSLGVLLAPSPPDPASPVVDPSGAPHDLPPRPRFVPPPLPDYVPR